MRRFFKKKKREAPEELPEGEETADEVAVQPDLELTHVGPWEIIAPIGSGGMGTVYKAIDRSQDQTVAIKVLHRKFDLDKKKRRRDFLGREILIAASLNHENIIRMHDKIIEQEDREGRVRRCLVMELVDGHNLSKHIKDRDLTLDQMLDLCIRLCNGLDFLHHEGIIHKDIKPQNFLVSRDLRQVKIVDFGLSTATGSWRTRWMKSHGGTRRYMSPEQLSKKRVIDARSDIFSFGLTIYELFAGRHPCNATDPREMMKQIRGRYKFEPPSKHNGAMSPKMDKIILKSLRRPPGRRYQSVTEMLLDLTRINQSRI